MKYSNMLQSQIRLEVSNALRKSTDWKKKMTKNLFALFWCAWMG